MHEEMFVIMLSLQQNIKNTVSVQNKDRIFTQ